MPTEVEQALADAEISVEFEDAREEALIRMAVQGKDTEDFLFSDVGRFVTGAALQDQADIEAKLATVSPWNKRKITKLQQQHRAIGLAVSWLCEAVNLGAAAVRELHVPSE